MRGMTLKRKSSIPCTCERGVNDHFGLDKGNFLVLVIMGIYGVRSVRGISSYVYILLVLQKLEYQGPHIILPRR